MSLLGADPHNGKWSLPEGRITWLPKTWTRYFPFAAILATTKLCSTVTMRKKMSGFHSNLVRGISTSF